MATNHTANYNLNQWQATDPVLRTDFNEDNTKIDTALKSLSTTTQQHTTQLAQQAAQLAARGNITFATTSYVGTGKGKTNTLTFSKKPIFIYICGPVDCSNLFLMQGQSRSMGHGMYNNYGNNTVTWSGNSVSWSSMSNDENTQCNQEGSNYLVLAFLDAGT